MAAFLLFLLLLQSPPFIVASSDDTATPTTEVSPTLAAVLIVFVAVFFFSGLVFVVLRKIIDSGWCGFSAGGDTLNRVGGTRPPRPSDGLTKEAVQTLPIYFYKDVKMHRQLGKGEIECAVCLNEFQDTQVLRVLPKCSHVFHPDCVEPWLLSQATCPVCRTIVQNNEASDNHVITIDQYSTLTKSHSTGHSPVWTGDRDHRFTLRLPEEAAVMPSQFRSPRIGYRSNILCWGLNRDYKPDRSASNHTPSLPHQDYPLSDTAHS